MDDEFVDKVQDNNDYIADIEYLENKCPVLQLEYQVYAQQDEHGQQRQEGREKQEAFDQVTLQQGQDAPLQTASRTIYPRMFLKGAAALV
jgi:hypothetical protein